MKKIYTLHKLFIGVALLLASSCQTADDMADLTGGSSEELKGTLVQLNASMLTVSGADTRAEVAADAAFPTKGTTMTVVMTVNNASRAADYTFDGTNWMPNDPAKALRWEDNEQEHSFIAVSPAQDGLASDDRTLTLPSVYTRDNVTAWDGLLTTTEILTTKAKSKIALPLHRGLVKITVLSDATSVTLNTGLDNTSSFDLTGEVNPVTESTSPAAITMYTNGVVHTAYVLPGTYTKASFKYTTTGGSNAGSDKVFAFGNDAETSITLNGGGNYICSEGIAMITSTEGRLGKKLPGYPDAKELYITGVMNNVDLADLVTHCVSHEITGLYIDAAGTETIPDDAINATSKKLTLKLSHISLFRTTKIGKSAFNGIKTLQTINLPVLTEITGGSAFSDCISLKDVYAPHWVTLSGNAAGSSFAGCTSLEEIFLPKFETSAYYNMFNGCTSLKTAIFPCLKQMQGDMFKGCKALTKLVLGKADNLNYETTATAGAPELFIVNDDYIDGDALGKTLPAVWKKAHSGYNLGEKTATSLTTADNYKVSYTAPVE